MRSVRGVEDGILAFEIGLAGDLAFGLFVVGLGDLGRVAPCFFGEQTRESMLAFAHGWDQVRAGWVVADEPRIVQEHGEKNTVRSGITPNEGGRGRRETALSANEGQRGREAASAGSTARMPSAEPWF